MSTLQSLAANFDLAKLPADFYTDPYPYYAALQEFDPVRRMPDGSYFLTRYRDILAVYKDSEACSSDKKVEFKPKYGDTPLYDHHTTSLVFNDPPLHTRVRRLIFGALTARAIAALEPGLIALVDRLIADMAEKREVDLIEDFASAIPVEIIGNLLAVPHEERSPLRDWSLAILGALEPVLTKAAAERGNRAVTDFLAYLETLIEDRRKNPGDPEKDVLTKLMQGDVNGERLTPKELLHNCIFLLNAGHETTTNLIGNGLVALDRFPQQKQRLIENPGLIKTAIEEVLRYESSNQLGNRITVKPFEVGGVAMPEGTRITVCIGAGNRDPHEFPGPQNFDVGRTPNRHLAFASGIHQCVGMNLARLEGQIAISHFLARFPRYQLAGEPVGGGRVRFRGFLKIPCRVG
jgi:cytochrome P450